MPPASNFGQDITNTTPNDGNDLSGNVIRNIERMGGTLLIPRVAGKGVIKVVKRCDDAKENNQLGKYNLINKIDLVQENQIFIVMCKH